MSEPLLDDSATVKSVKETHETTTTSGDTSPIPSPPVADDAIRKQVAWAVISSDSSTCILVLILLFKYGGALSKDVLAIVATIIGTIIGYRARDTGTVIGYLFGSSSGSTAKSALLEKK